MTTVGDQFLKSKVNGFTLRLDVPLRDCDIRMARDSRKGEHVALCFSKPCQCRVSQAIRLEWRNPGELQGLLVPLLGAGFFPALSRRRKASARASSPYTRLKTQSPYGLHFFAWPFRNARVDFRHEALGILEDRRSELPDE